MGIWDIWHKIQDTWVWDMRYDIWDMRNARVLWHADPVRSADSYFRKLCFEKNPDWRFLNLEILCFKLCVTELLLSKRRTAKWIPYAWLCSWSSRVLQDVIEFAWRRRSGRGGVEARMGGGSERGKRGAIYCFSISISKWFLDYFGAFSKIGRIRNSCGRGVQTCKMHI